jgi:hypothetical protein
MDINSAYEIFEKSYLEVVNKHIPLKNRKPVQTPAPFMNKTLRKEIYKKRMLHNKFLKNRSKVNWENYRKPVISLFSLIIHTLGCSLFTITFVLPILFAMLMKKTLKTSDTFAGSFIITNYIFY